jgi:sulfate/thiosulfate transport system substrate-binding protein
VPLQRRQLLSLLPAALAAGSWAPGTAMAATSPATLLNVSYDLSREFYRAFNTAFAAQWMQRSGQALIVSQSHGGASRQARSVADGLPADVVTLNQHNDIDLLVRHGLLAADWATRLPHRSAPTTSVSVIVVRAGNPRRIRDWADLAREGVSVIVPNPKTSGNGRAAWLAAWGSALLEGATVAQARDRATRLIANVPVLDSGSRSATTTFAQRGLGDALVTFESELPLIERQFGSAVEVVYPPRTLLSENPVAVIDRVVDRRGGRTLAEAYLRHLYSAEGQELAARHHLRPRSAEVAARWAHAFPRVATFTVHEVFGGWSRAQREHFDDGALLDQALLQARGR